MKWDSKFISLYTNSPYTHIGLASCPNGLLEIIEFKSSSGGVSSNLAQVVKKRSGQIDVYRPSPKWVNLVFKQHDDQYCVEEKTVIFTKDKAKDITNTMRHLTGLDYGYRRIFWFIKRKFPLLRLFYNPKNSMNDTVKELIYPVCSTTVSYAFSKHGFDVLKNKADEWTEPGHIANSPNLNYLFTCVWDSEKDSSFLT